MTSLSSGIDLPETHSIGRLDIQQSESAMNLDNNILSPIEGSLRYALELNIPVNNTKIDLSILQMANDAEDVEDFVLKRRIANTHNR